jgi:hypothetical protein
MPPRSYSPSDLHHCLLSRNFQQLCSFNFFLFDVIFEDPQDKTKCKETPNLTPIRFISIFVQVPTKQSVNKILCTFAKISDLVQINIINLLNVKNLTQ